MVFPANRTMATGLQNNTFFIGSQLNLPVYNIAFMRLPSFFMACSVLLFQLLLQLIRI